MAARKVTFPGHNHHTLSGLLHTPDTDTVAAWVLFAHCFTCSKNSKAAAYVSRALSAQGFGVLRFDFTGLGESEGSFERTNFSSNIEDLVAAATWLASEERTPTLLVGHSLGGAAAIAAAHQLPEIRAVATIAAPFDPSDITRHFTEDIEEIRAQGKATVSLAGRPFTITQQFLDDLDEQKQKERVQTLDRPLLILHSPSDRTVGIANATRYFTTAKHPKSFVSLDDANHLLTHQQDAAFAAHLIAALARRYAV